MARGAAANLRAEQAIESGLGLYSQGDLVGALKRWRQALEIDPDNRRAREYVTYVEEHYEVLDRKLRGERAEGEEVGQTIEMEADDPMDELDAYDSVEVSMPVADAPGSADLDESGVPTQEMKAQQLADAMAAAAAAEREDDATGATRETGETTKAEGLVGLRRAAARKSSPPAALPTPVPALEESIDEGWSLDGMEDALGIKSEIDTLEAVPNPDMVDDLSDLGARAETLDPYGGEPDEPDQASDGDEVEPASAIQRPSDDQTGEVTRPERRPHSDSGRMRAGTRSTAPAPGLARGRPSSAPPPSVQSPRAEFDLADFDDPDAPAIGAAMGSVLSGPATSEDGAEVRVTFRSPRESDQPRPGAPSAPAGEARKAASAGGRGQDHGPGEDDEATVDRLRPPVSFDDETYERPSLSMLSEVGGDLDSLYGDADSDELGSDLPLAGRPGSEGDTGMGDSSERETTQLYQRAMRPSKGAVSMELIAAELEADLDESVSIDPSLGEDAIKARVGWLINRARSENQAGHFPVAVVAIDLALEQHPDSAVAQKLIHSNREVLYEVYRSFLGDLSAVPSLAMSMDKIPMHELDHRAAFLLSRIDGALTLEDVLDVSGMARLEALRHLSRLLLRGILEFRS